jgi:hypothetical protein
VQNKGCTNCADTGWIGGPCPYCNADGTDVSRLPAGAYLDVSGCTPEQVAAIDRGLAKRRFKVAK